MNILAKKLVAGGLVLGVGAVWVPRLTGTNPFQAFSTDASTDVAPLPVSSAVEVDHFGGEVGSDDESSESVDAEGQRGMVDEIETALQFLESRGGGVEASLAREVITTMPSDDSTSVPIGSPIVPVTGGESIPQEAVAVDRAGLVELLERHPLHTIIAGSGRVTATFGFHRVTVGDSLFVEDFVVSAIDGTGVTFDTPDGPVRSWLPAPGESVVPLTPPVAPIPETEPAPAPQLLEDAASESDEIE